MRRTTIKNNQRSFPDVIITGNEKRKSKKEIRVIRIPLTLSGIEDEMRTSLL